MGCSVGMRGQRHTELGVSYGPLQTSMNDMFAQMIEAGYFARKGKSCAAGPFPIREGIPIRPPVGSQGESRNATTMPACDFSPTVTARCIWALTRLSA